jgi:serine protease
LREKSVKPEELPVVTIDPEARERSLRSIRSAETEMTDTARKEPDPVPRPLRTRSLRAGAPPPPPVLGKAVRSLRTLEPEDRVEVKKLARRALITDAAIEKQVEANELMLNALDKFNMKGEITMSRGGQMVIQLGDAGASPTQFADADKTLNPLEFLAIEKNGGCSNPDNLAAIQKDAALATQCVVEELKDSGQFEYVEKDYIFANQFFPKPKEKPVVKPPVSPNPTAPTPTPAPAPVTPTSITPNDPLWALQWHFKNTGAAAGQSPGGASFQDFWSRQAVKGSEQVTVAVIDTGLQMQHPDILNSPNVVAGWDMVSDPRMGNDGDGRDSDPNDPGDICDPTAPYAADTFHGTHVAGTIGAAATNNGSGVAGGAWQVKIVPVRALGKCGGRLSDINDAIRWAAGEIDATGADGLPVHNENPADIINLSIGLFTACPASLQDAIDSVTAKGVIVVSAAGNARVNTQYYAPGGCKNVISVAAGDARGQIAPYSNFGSDVDLLAPGGDVMRDDNADGRPDGVLSTKAAKNCYDPVTGEPVDACFYAYEQGTSMAAPHVSAALALLKSRAPLASPAELTATLLAAVDPRTDEQCSGLCASYPGTEPIPGSPDMCKRPCGSLLNLSRVPLMASGGGGKQK